MAKYIILLFFSRESVYQHNPKVDLCPIRSRSNFVPSYCVFCISFSSVVFDEQEQIKSTSLKLSYTKFQMLLGVGPY